MFGARTNCYGCHTQQQSVKGQAVLVATQRACVTCHGEQYAQTFEQWKQTMEMSLKDAQEAYEKARAALTKATDVPADARAKVEKLLAGASADLNLVQHGNGVHNITYAMLLLDTVSSRCGEALRALPAKK
jgi:predicted CXXCH cytochrome family protein